MQLNDTEVRELHVPVYASFEGVSDDLSAVAVEFGLSSGPTVKPTAWVAGSWLLEYGVWIANLTIGVTGADLTLSAGNNYIWIKFTHSGNVVEVQVARVFVVTTT